MTEKCEYANYFKDHYKYLPLLMSKGKGRAARILMKSKTEDDSEGEGH